VDFAIFQRRIHSLQRADGTLPNQTLNGHHSLQRADGTLPDQICNEHYSPLRRLALNPLSNSTTGRKLPSMSKGAATKDRIIESALRTASVEGLEGISLGRLAADVGMSKSGLFAHFASKEELQLDVLEAASARFVDVVVRPAMQEPRGEPRVRSMFEHWLVWERHESLPGGCVFMHAAAELDDRPGPARDSLVQWQRQWLQMLARAVRIAVDAGDFKPETDADQFAFQMLGLILGYYHTRRLLNDPFAEAHVRQGFDALVAAARA
jgi:AcrR family transcriptional regulator